MCIKHAQNPFSGLSGKVLQEAFELEEQGERTKTRKKTEEEVRARKGWGAKEGQSGCPTKTIP